jgi:hypothetical protein
MAGILSEKQLLRELRVLYANRPMRFEADNEVLQRREGQADSQDLEGLAVWMSLRIVTL